MPDMLMRVYDIRESLWADIQVVWGSVEKSSETANSIVLFFRDIISGSISFFENTGISATVPDFITTEVVVPSRDEPSS